MPRSTKLNFYTTFSKVKRQIYGNVCGPKLFKLDKLIPNFKYHMACREHDFYYDCGGNEKDRNWADQRFWTKMIIEVRKKAKWYNKIWMWSLTPIYYGAVVAFGRFGFEYGPYKTRKELIKYANKKYKIKL